MSGLTLHAFLLANREDILERSRAKLGRREVPTPTEAELTDGLPRFLDQLIEVLGSKNGDLKPDTSGVSISATIHGGDLLHRGLTVGQVVQDYGSICQSVTEVAAERHTAITAEEFQTFNQCLDEAIAGAVTEYEHQRDRSVGGDGTAKLGFLAHEMRNLLATSILTFEVLSRGSVGVNGNTGTLLGRSLKRMRVLVDRTLAEVRLEADIQDTDRVLVAELLEEIEIIATIEAKAYDVQLSIEPGERGVAVIADRQILASVIANLVQNALKFTRQRGHIAVRSFSAEERVMIEVQDECGGLPPGKAEELFLPFEKRGSDKTGLGLGLSISLKGVRASGGELSVRDLPGKGCVFTVDLPRAPRMPADELPIEGAAAEGASDLAGPPDEPAGGLSRPSVLLIDDDEDFLAALEDLLSGQYNLTVVRDGAQALQLIRSASFDLALVDLHLPVIDGLSLVRTVRKSDRRRDPAFLVISGESNPQVKAEALALAAVDYMIKPFDGDELMARMARMLATVTREASLVADAMTDSLTGLANYRCFSQNLDLELERSRRYGSPLSLITLDLDNLKAINDRHGHGAGDDAIRLVAKVLTEAVRKFELVARQGGDEFALILPNTPGSSARQLAERLRAAVGAQVVLGLNLSASIGLASWENGSESSLDADALLKASDEALFRAKRAGRDRIEWDAI